MEDTVGKDSGSKTKKYSLKRIWRKLRLSKKEMGEKNQVSSKAPEVDQQVDDLPEELGAQDRVEAVVVDINEIDKDKIRTSSKETRFDVSEFPSREEVKEKIENAHKYYGVKCVYNYCSDPECPEDKKELQPNWYYILERPLVEQYVLMNNYIRKLSVMAALKNEQVGVEEEAIEEDVSSISSSSDYTDFAPDSMIVKRLKEMKKIGCKDPGTSTSALTKMEQDLRQLKLVPKSQERTIRTNDYTIVIREPADLEVGQSLSSSSTAVGPDEVEAERLMGVEVQNNVPDSSGDGLPDVWDFDLSYNLVDGPVERKNRCQPFYHWQGNSTPTKTPLLNMDSQPPVRPRAPGTAKDFLSFRNLSLSSEFTDSWRDYSASFAEESRSAYLKELTGTDPANDFDYGCVDVATQSKAHTEKFLVETEQDPIMERAVLVSEYVRECESMVNPNVDPDIVCSDYHNSKSQSNCGTPTSCESSCSLYPLVTAASPVETSINNNQSSLGQDGGCLSGAEDGKPSGQSMDPRQSGQLDGDFHLESWL